MSTEMEQTMKSNKVFNKTNKNILHSHLIKDSQYIINLLIFIIIT